MFVFNNHGAACLLRNIDPSFNFFGKIKVGNNVYIGEISLMVPRVTIGSKVIIGSGSVVTKSIPDNCIVGGNPAKIVGDYDSFIERHKRYNIPTKNLNNKKKKEMIQESAESLFIKKKWLTK